MASLLALAQWERPQVAHVYLTCSSTKNTSRIVRTHFSRSPLPPPPPRVPDTAVLGAKNLQVSKYCYCCCWPGMHSLRTTGLAHLEALARGEWVPGFCTGFWPLSTYSLLWIAATEGMEGDPLLPMCAMNVPILLVHWDYASLSTQCKIMSACALRYKPYFSLLLLCFSNF